MPCSPLSSPRDPVGRRRRRRGRGPRRARRRDPGLRRGDASRGVRPPRGREPDRPRLDPQPHLEQAFHHDHRMGCHPVEAASNTLSPQTSVVISARVAPGQDAQEAFAAVEAHLRAHAPSARSSSSPTSTAATPSWSTPADGPSKRLVLLRGRIRRRLGRRRHRGIDSVHLGPRPRVPEAQILVTGSRTRTRGRTARTSRCTSRLPQRARLGGAAAGPPQRADALIEAAGAGRA